MPEDVIVHRLNVIIVLIVAVLAVLLWPVFSQLLVYAVVLLFLAVAGAIGWSLAQSI
ncbi:hypothetical protein [Halostagnicola sp. A-GB9-2]|uniref:hypothetical protein n=1 Tax=Halostagnicola sp. A-GB9-2 TaxID=3048066 RepID=UPI0024BF1C3D|nr:hypothetical protein [Halostagnicola sp. A-GB9-2]MDJ1432571.1 hypothetical protein [Halostagnicola sp. A-GB9-2]